MFLPINKLIFVVARSESFSKNLRNITIKNVHISNCLTKSHLLSLSMNIYVCVLYANIYISLPIKGQDKADDSRL